MLSVHNTSPFIEKVTNSIDAMLAYWDKDQMCRFANNAYSSWFGKKPEEMIDQMTLKQLLGPLYVKNLPYIEAAYKGEIQRFERAIPSPDGLSIRHSLATYIPNKVDGEVQGIVVHVSDITYLKEIEAQLIESKKIAEKMATHDHLTGLPNRVLLEGRLHRDIKTATDTKKWMAVGVLDLDDFKKINDQYGHLIGDTFLKEMAKRIHSSLRPCDGISRLGGDEFVILFNELRSEGQLKRLAKKLTQLAQAPLSIDGKRLSPSVSLGLALYPKKGQTPRELLMQADKALYAAKGLGKNCFVVAE